MADVIRYLDNLVEMEVAISGKGCVFRGQTSGVAGKVFQACGRPATNAARTLTNLQFGAYGEKACHHAIFKSCNALIMNPFRNYSVEG